MIKFGITRSLGYIALVGAFIVWMLGIAQAVKLLYVGLYNLTHSNPGTGVLLMIGGVAVIASIGYVTSVVLPHRKTISAWFDSPVKGGLKEEIRPFIAATAIFAVIGIGVATVILTGFAIASSAKCYNDPACKMSDSFRKSKYDYNWAITMWLPKNESSTTPAATTPASAATPSTSTINVPAGGQVTVRRVSDEATISTVVKGLETDIRMSVDGIYKLSLKQFTLTPENAIYMSKRMCVTVSAPENSGLTITGHATCN